MYTVIPNHPHCIFHKSRKGPEETGSYSWHMIANCTSGRLWMRALFLWPALLVSHAYECQFVVRNVTCDIMNIECQRLCLYVAINIVAGKTALVLAINVIGEQCGGSFAAWMIWSTEAKCRMKQRLVTQRAKAAWLHSFCCLHWRAVLKQQRSGNQSLALVCVVLSQVAHL